MGAIKKPVIVFFFAALEADADIIVMIHPDYQYDATKIAGAQALPIIHGECDAVFGSRVLNKGALRGGMPVYKFLGNRLLTGIENLVLRQSLSNTMRFTSV